MSTSTTLVHLYMMNLKQFVPDQYLALVNCFKKIDKRINRSTMVSKISNDTCYLDLLKIKCLSFLIKVNDYTCPDQTPGEIMQKIINDSFKPRPLNNVVSIPLDPKAVTANNCCACNFAFFSAISSICTHKKIEIVTNPAKTAIEASLTSALNNFSDCFKITSKYFIEMITFLCNSDPEIGRLVAERKILFEFKGGMPMKKYLLIMYPEQTSSINNLFGSGDNDTSIYIDPRIPNYDKIYRRVCDNMHYIMTSKAMSFYSELTPVLVDFFNEPVKLGEELYRISPTKSQDFIGRIEGNELKLNFDREESRIRTSLTEIKFLDTVGCLKYFTLIRWKLPINVHIPHTSRTSRFYSELLDVSIPHKQSCGTNEFFKHFEDHVTPIDSFIINNPHV